MNSVDGTRADCPSGFQRPRGSTPVAATEPHADAERRLRLALQATHLSLWEWDIVADRIPWTTSLQALTGLSADSFDGSRAGMLKLAHPDDRAMLAAALDRALEGRHEFHSEYRIVRPDGAVRWIAEHGQVTRDAAGRPLRMIGTVADVTRRRQIEDALLDARDSLERRVDERTRELARAKAALRDEIAERRVARARERGLVARLVSASEDERRRIAHELHDTFGQQLSVLLLQLAALRRQCDATSPPVAPLAQIDRLFETARQLDEALDRVESDLRPPALDELGLEAALRQHAHGWSADTGIPIELQDDGLQGLSLSPLVETTIYRIVQEALANVRRHAQAGAVRLTIDRRDTMLSVTIADDGRGFERSGAAAEPRHPRGLGLAGMRERAVLVAGEIEIASQAGRGTTVTLLIPLSAQPACGR